MQNRFEILTTQKEFAQKINDFLENESFIKSIKSIELDCINFDAYANANSNTLARRIYNNLILLKHKHKKNIKICSATPFSEQSLLRTLNGEKGTKKSWFGLSWSEEGIEVEEKRELEELIANYLRPSIEDKLQKLHSNHFLLFQALESVFSEDSCLRSPSFENLSKVIDYIIDPDPKEALGKLTQSLQELLKKLEDKLSSMIDKNYEGEFEGFKQSTIDSLHKASGDLIDNLEVIQKEENEQIIKIAVMWLVKAIPKIIENCLNKKYISAGYDFLTSVWDSYQDWKEYDRNKFQYAYMLPIFRILTQDIAPAFAFLARKSLKNIFYITTSDGVYLLDYSGFNPFEEDCGIATHFGCVVVGKWPSKEDVGRLEILSSTFTASIFNEQSTQEQFESLFPLHHKRIDCFIAPYFNSCKLVHWIKSAQEPETQLRQDTKNGKNYLIITQCPMKANAKLNEALLNKLGLEVRDGLDSREPKPASKPSKHNPAIDYSQYEIQNNATDESAFILSLSPFGFLPKGEGDKRSQAYLEGFFQPEANLEGYLDKDEGLFKHQIHLFGIFFESLGKGINYRGVQTKSFTIQETILMALMHQVIKKHYKNIKKTTSTPERIDRIVEAMTIDGEKINLFPLNSQVQLNSSHHEILRYYEEKPIGNDGSYICIEILAEQIFSQDLSSCDMKKLCNQYFQYCDPTNKLTPEEKQKKEQAIFISYFYWVATISCFPFKDFLHQADHITPMILQTLITQHPKLFDYFLRDVISNLQESFIKKLQTIQSDLENEAQKKGINIKQIIRENIFTFDSSGFSIADISGIVTDIVVGLIDQNWVTGFEKQKTNFAHLIYTKFVDKNDAPLALKREEGIYYPITINQTSFSFSFQNLILGGELCTGGLGEIEAQFCKISETEPSLTSEDANTPSRKGIIRNYQLGMLFGLVCLDELRSGNQNKIEDAMFFKQDHSEKDFANYLLDLEDNNVHLEIYDSYNLKDQNDEASAIDSYQIVMQYFKNIQSAEFDAMEEEKEIDPKDHRKVMKALERIGKNNIKGLYVGVSQASESEARPKIIGRLATTIIMKDGLWIG